MHISFAIRTGETATALLGEVSLDIQREKEDMQKLYLETESDRRRKSCKSKIPKNTKAVIKPLRLQISRLTFQRSLEAVCKLYESNHPCISMYFEIRSTTTLIHGDLYLLSNKDFVKIFKIFIGHHFLITTFFIFFNSFYLYRQHRLPVLASSFSLYDLFLFIAHFSKIYVWIFKFQYFPNISLGTQLQLKENKKNKKTFTPSFKRIVNLFIFNQILYS